MREELLFPLLMALLVLVAAVGTLAILWLTVVVANRRKLLRFTMRDLLWWSVVLGLCLGWVLDHQRLVVERNGYYESWVHMCSEYYGSRPLIAPP